MCLFHLSKQLPENKIFEKRKCVYLDLHFELAFSFYQKCNSPMDNVFTLLVSGLQKIDCNRYSIAMFFIFIECIVAFIS